MKKHIFAYLFVFTVLILLFHVVNSNKILTNLESDWQEEIMQRKQLQDTIRILQDRIDEEVYFSLIQNEGAQIFFQGEDLIELENQLMDAIYETNLLPNNEKLIPFAPMGEGGYLINKVKVLNHKWVIADFTDGSFWGEMLMLYSKDKIGRFHFEVKESFLYPLSD